MIFSTGLGTFLPISWHKSHGWLWLSSVGSRANGVSKPAQFSCLRHCVWGILRMWEKRLEAHKWNSLSCYDSSVINQSTSNRRWNVNCLEPCRRRRDARLLQHRKLKSVCCIRQLYTSAAVVLGRGLTSAAQHVTWTVRLKILCQDNAAHALTLIS